MKRPRVLLDCDGVLSDFVGAVLPLIADVTQSEAKREDWNQWGFAESFGLTPAQKRIVQDQIALPGFCDGLEMYAGALAGVDAIRGIADVYIVTSPWNSSPTWTHEREAWLWRYFGIPHRYVFHCSAKQFISGHVFVDDKTEALKAWSGERRGGHAIRWATPHNRSEDWLGDDTNSWADVLAHVGEVMR